MVTLEKALHLTATLAVQYRDRNRDRIRAESTFDPELMSAILLFEFSLLYNE